MKRGQITLFIIIGISVAIVIVLGLNFSGNLEFIFASEFKQKLNIINSFTGSCIRDAYIESIREVSSNGGYYKKQDNFKILEIEDQNFMAYHYFEGDLTYPSEETVSKEIEKAFFEKLDSCLSIIRIEGIEMSYKINKYNFISLNNELELDLRIDVNDEDQSTTIDIQETIYEESKFNEIFNLAKFISDSNKEDPEFLCISCIDNIAEASNLFIDIYYYDNSTNIVRIYENHTEIKQELIFANKYEIA